MTSRASIKDRSYGIIPVRRKVAHECVSNSSPTQTLVHRCEPSHDWEFLAVRQKHGRHWSFPKGHPEPGESPKITATRELQEETGLRVVEFVEHTPFEENYTFYHERLRIRKTVLFYIARVEGNLEAQCEEVSDLKWLSFEECCKTLTYARGIEMCESAYRILKSIDSA